MNIKEFIIHRIDKQPHHDPVVHLRRKPLKANDPRVLKFTSLAVEIFQANEDKPSSVFADFNLDTANYPFSDWCLKYFAGSVSLIQFTKDSTNRLAHCMKPKQLATGGFVIFAAFEVEGVSKLLVVMLHPQDGLSITENLDFEEVTHLELKHIDKAALVTGPANGTFGNKPVTYAGFRKEMSQYFQEFIGPDAFRNPSKDSAGLIDALEDYARDNAFDSAQLDGVRIQIRRYAQTVTDQHAELDLTSISAMVDPVRPNAFASYAASRGVSAFIKPDNQVFKRWKVIRYKSPDGLVLQFKAEMVGQPGTNHRLELNETAKTLTIKQLETELIEQIKAAKS